MSDSFRTVGYTEVHYPKLCTVAWQDEDDPVAEDRDLVKHICCMGNHGEGDHMCICGVVKSD